jgi:transketolase
VEAEWQTLFDAYAASHAELAAEFTRRTQGALPAHWGQAVAAILSEAQASTAANATRKSSQLALEKLGPLLPEFVGGSADLAESNLTHWAGSRTVTAANAGGNYVNYGVREFAMAAAMNGLSLHGGFIPYGGTFLVFSDYARNAIRMAALMNQRAIYVLTHDSIGLGEDGPTHQPVEHTASLRLIPNCAVWRPCDNAETTAAWIAAVERQDGPTALILTRPHPPTHLRPPPRQPWPRGAPRGADGRPGRGG